jgi:hypothetical protein
MRPDRFRDFTRELFAPTTGSYARFRGLLRTYLPDDPADLDVWLETTDFPERFRLTASTD